MQTNDNLNQVWGEPVKSVHSLQDLAKLVKTAEVRAEPVQEQEPEVKSLGLGRGRAITKPEIHRAAVYAIAHPEETYAQVAAKFGVNQGSLYSRVFRLKNNGREKTKAQAKSQSNRPSREELAARLAKARAAKAAKAAKAEERKKNGWVHTGSSTSTKPLIERDEEGYRLIEVGGRTARMLADRVVPKEDMVNHPAHYKAGGIETIDFIEAKNLNYNLGNVVKYVTRAKLKGSMLQDLEKAAWYLNREIETLKK